MEQEWDRLKKRLLVAICFHVLTTMNNVLICVTPGRSKAFLERRASLIRRLDAELYHRAQVRGKDRSPRHSTPAPEVPGSRS